MKPVFSTNMKVNGAIMAAALCCALSGAALAHDGRVSLMAAEDLIGEDILTSDGHEAGEISYLMIDKTSANVRYVLLEEEGALNLKEGELVAVPFSMLDMLIHDDDGRHVSATLEQLQGAERVTKERLADLTDPAVIAGIYQYYLTPPEARVPAETQNVDEEDALPHLVVARNVIHTVIPGVQPSRGLVGSQVGTTGDADFGEIDQIILNVDDGNVAYALVTHGGVLGIGEDWYALPLQAMTWVSSDTAYLTDFGEAAKAHFRAIRKTEETPRSVARAELADFYQAYGVEVEWGDDKSSDAS